MNIISKEKAHHKHRFGLTRLILLVSNVFFAVLLVITYLSPFIDPHDHLILPFFGLLYPYLLIINFLFLVAWIIRKRFFFLISLVTILLGWSFLQRIVQFNGKQELPEGVSPVKVISYNVQNLALSNTNRVDYHLRDQIVDFLGRENPDIVCLQEFVAKGDSAEFQISEICRRLRLPYYTYVRYVEASHRNIYAILTLSRFPILHSKGLKKDDTHHYAVISDVVIGQDTFRIFNVHLESIRFKQEDYEFISDIEKKIGDEKELRKGSEQILDKMKTAFVRRSAQAVDLRNLVNTSQFPMIMCGDFNDTPFSYAYQQFSKILKDTFVESGRGFGNTYAGRLPSYRIDYIWVSKKMASRQYRTYRVHYSDHYPISAMVYMNE